MLKCDQHVFSIRESDSVRVVYSLRKALHSEHWALSLFRALSPVVWAPSSIFWGLGGVFWVPSWLPQHAQQGKKKASNIIPTCFQKSSPRAPKSLPRTRTSKERPRSPQISQQSPSSSQGLSKVRPKGLRGTLWEAFWDDLGLQIEVSEPMLAHFLSWALQVASLNVIYDIRFAFSPSLSSLCTSHIAFILFIVLPSVLRYQVVPHVPS